MPVSVTAVRRRRPEGRRYNGPMVVIPVDVATARRRRPEGRRYDDADRKVGATMTPAVGTHAVGGSALRWLRWLLSRLTSLLLSREEAPNPDHHARPPGRGRLRF